MEELLNGQPVGVLVFLLGLFIGTNLGALMMAFLMAFEHYDRGESG
jgi:hypothetical protein